MTEAIQMQPIGIIRSPYQEVKGMPYVSHFDTRENVVCGWIDKHFENSQRPKGLVVN